MKIEDAERERMEIRREKRVRVVQKNPNFPSNSSNFKGIIVIFLERELELEHVNQEPDLPPGVAANQ